MPSRIVRTEDQRESLITFLRSQKLPMTISWQKGADRTVPQNSLQWKWVAQITEYLGDNDAAGVQAILKLEIGVPILRAENETFSQFYDMVIKTHNYETKIGMMRAGMISVTSIMTKKQMVNFLDRVWAQYTGMGIALVNPDPEMVDYMKRHRVE